MCSVIREVNCRTILAECRLWTDCVWNILLDVTSDQMYSSFERLMKETEKKTV
jgi:hypothetical protein